MKTRLFKKIIFTIASFVITTIAFVPSAGAEELVITGNGDGSSSSVNVTANSTSNIQQSNTADVENKVDTSANTGNNTASNNSGDSTIKTGDVSQQTDISNNVNTSVADQTCCSNPLPSPALIISGNGADSNNNVSVNSGSQTTVAINQDVKINNHIVEFANTGNNTADNNTGKVNIQTGNIYSSNRVNNDSVNSAQVSVPGSGQDGDVNIKVSNNGSGSDNNVIFEKNNNLKAGINNSSYINNDIESFLNSGNNKVNGNIGDVTIKTGDIISEIDVLNNTSYSELDDRCHIADTTQPQTNPDDQNPNPEDQHNQDLPPAPKPVDPISSSSSSTGPSDPSSQAGQVAAAVASLLPATGNNMLFFVFLSSIVMFFMGAYLRLHSGNSPNFSFSI